MTTSPRPLTESRGVLLAGAVALPLAVGMAFTSPGPWSTGAWNLGILRVLAYLYGFMAVSSIATFVHPRLRRPEARPIRQAINTWWAPALACGFTSLLGVGATIPLFAVVSAWTLHEYLGMLPPEDRHPATDAVAYGAVPIHYTALAFGGSDWFYGGILAWTGIVLPLVHAFVRGPAGMLGAVPRLQLGMLLTVLALSHVASIALLPVVGPAGGQGLAVLLLLCVMSNDAAQYVSGKLLGRHKLAPLISPKKTWEGLAGGALVTGLVAAAVAPLLTPFSPEFAVSLGVAFSVTGLLGDLLVSAIKRDAGVKDTGAVLPGQGGILDRCDSILISAPLFAHVLLAWQR